MPDHLIGEKSTQLNWVIIASLFIDLRHHLDAGSLNLTSLQKDINTNIIKNI